MTRKADCRKYKKWKKEQAKKLKQSKKQIKKRRRKDLATDCIDEDEPQTSVPRLSTKIISKKCKKKRKKKKPSKFIRKIVKHISFGDLILRCIKPSVDDRFHVLNPRHNVCLDLNQEEIDLCLEGLQTSRSRLFYMPKRRKYVLGPKPCGRKRPDEFEANDSECDSICSFDSEVCLAGVKLTAKDREEIKKFKRDAQEGITNEEEE